MNTVTCIIPVYNGERYIRDTLQCLVEQTVKPDRLVILDNCSTDRTREIVEMFPSLRPEWQQNETNIGLLGNLNRALSFSESTEHLHLLMADDLVLPTFYEKALAAMKSTPAPTLCYCHNETIDGTGQVIGPLKRKTARAARIVPHREYLRRHAELDNVLLPGVLFKTSGKPPLCLFRDFPQVADVIFLAEWGRQCAAIWEISEYLCQYRMHPFNATISTNRRKVEDWVMGEWRAMETVAGWMTEPAAAAWLRRQKLRCLFAARSEVKAQLVRDHDPEGAMEIRRAVRRVVPWLEFQAGRFAVSFRDSLWYLLGRRSKLKEAVGLE